MMMLRTACLAATFLWSASAFAQSGAITGSRTERTCDERGNCSVSTTYDRAPAPVEAPPRKGPGTREDVYYVLPSKPEAPRPPDPNHCGRGFHYTSDGCKPVPR